MRCALMIALTLALWGCGSGSKNNPEPPKEQPAKTGLRTIDGLSRYALGTPVTYGSVTIVPVVLASAEQNAKDAGQVPTDYISLAEAKKLGDVEISEMPSGQEVNRLYVRNLSKRPLLLLAGELMLGGKQDRVVAKDTVVPPGEEMPVPVFCVEHGRWTGQTGKFEFSESMVPQSVRYKVIAKADQQEVWDGVAKYNDSAGFKGDTGTVRGGLYDKAVQARINGDLAKFVQALQSQEDVVGMVYLVNGEIGSFELFGNVGLMNASREPLLRGFLAEAAVQPAKNVGAPDLDQVAKFIKDSLAGERRQTSLGRANANWSVDSNGIGGGESTLPAAEGFSTKEGGVSPSRKAGHDSENLLHGSYVPDPKR